MINEPIRDRQGRTEQEFLREYNPGLYERPSVTVDMLIFTVMNEDKENYRKLPEKSLKLLLVKRGVHPFLGQWALPGGFVGTGESLDEAAMRELKSETNVEEGYMEQLYTWGDVNRDPRMRVISCSYMALVDSGSLEVRAGDDAADAKWFTLEHRVLEEKKLRLDPDFALEKKVRITLSCDNENLQATLTVKESCTGSRVKVEREITETDGIAFDHAKMIQYAVERLRSKIEYTDIAFHLMTERFTLSELQQVYEVTLGKELLSSAFRRKIAGMVTETKEYTKDAGHRPAKLFKFKPEWRAFREK